MSPPYYNYCLDCEWSISERELSRSDLAQAAIDHAIETNHDIASGRRRENAPARSPDQEREANADQEQEDSEAVTLGAGDPADIPERPRTRDEFEAMLSEVLRGAYLNGVEIGFGADLQHPDRDVPDWEVQITPLKNPPSRKR